MLPTDERVRLRLGTAFIEHRDDLWPEGGAPDADWIRANVDSIVGVLKQAMRHDGQDARRLPRRLHWLMWLLDDLDRPRLPSP
jgi:hypothetical protein